jgi:hypothetical protein
MRQRQEEQRRLLLPEHLAAGRLDDVVGLGEQVAVGELAPLRTACRPDV